MVNDITKAITIQSFMDNIHDIVRVAQSVGETKYPKTNMEIEDDGTVWFTVYIQDDGELSEVYEKAKERFGAYADDVCLHFDSVEKSGQKHCIDLEFKEMLDTEEE